MKWVSSRFLGFPTLFDGFAIFQTYKIRQFSFQLQSFNNHLRSITRTRTEYSAYSIVVKDSKERSLPPVSRELCIGNFLKTISENCVCFKGLWVGNVHLHTILPMLTSEIFCPYHNIVQREDANKVINCDYWDSKKLFENVSWEKNKLYSFERWSLRGKTKFSINLTSTILSGFECRILSGRRIKLFSRVLKNRTKTNTSIYCITC